MGRPITKPRELRDGFYIEIRNKGSRSGVKIRRDTEAQMLRAIKEYERVKDIIVLGEYINGKEVKKEKAKAKAKEKAKAAKAKEKEKAKKS